MDAPVTPAPTLNEFLSNPAFRHCEWVCGQAVKLNIYTGTHAPLQAECSFVLGSYLQLHPIGSAYVGLHCRLQVVQDVRYRRPDLAVVLGPAIEGYLDRAPDLCIEIRSPDDSISDQIAKFADYFANGCQLGWLILPEEQSVLVLPPGAPSPRVVRATDSLHGGNILPGLEIPVNSLFV